MNPINEVYARIQQITNRIQQIKSLGQHPPGQITPGTQHPAAAGTGRNVASVSSTTPSSGGKGPEFQKLLQEALAIGQEGGTSSALGGTAGTNPSLDSLLGVSNSSSALPAANSAQLKQYQDALLQAIRELQARKNQSGTNG
jgi:hypothetical protein